MPNLSLINEQEELNEGNTRIYKIMQAEHTLGFRHVNGKPEQNR